jgi:hypothetical protein
MARTHKNVALGGSINALIGKVREGLLKISRQLRVRKNAELLLDFTRCR